MQPNPLLKRLGFSANDRVAILHCDDIGMCYSSVEAFADLHAYGLVSSGAVMVPCPWFLKAAEFARQHPEADLGVHLTTTAEWQTYRWGPISTRDPSSGLIDEQGYFYHYTAQAVAHNQPAAVQAEIEAQVARAIAAGMQPTHADTHMGTMGSAKFMPGYLRMAVAQHLPPMLMRLDAAGWQAAGLDAHSAAVAVHFSQALESLGMPLLDQIKGMPLNQPTGNLDIAKSLLRDLPAGITHFILHPSIDTPEIRAIAPDWQGRVANYEAFRSDELRAAVKDLGIHIIGYRALQTLMPQPEILAAALEELLPQG